MKMEIVIKGEPKEISELLMKIEAQHKCVLPNIKSIEPLTKLITSYEPTKQSMYIILQRCRKIETYDEIIKWFKESYRDRYELSFDIGAV